MPLYDYHCTHCGKSCEVLQKINAATLPKCPSCGNETLQRQVSAPHFQLKGSGWYVTDFKNKPAAESKSVEKTSPPESPPAEPKPESKPKETES